MASIQRRNVLSPLLSRTVCMLALGAMALAIPVNSDAAAQAKNLSVNWNDPELKGFAEERAAAVANGAAPEEESKLSTLNIPVLAFERPPEAVSRNLRAGPEAAPERAEHFDPANPVWYQIVEDYGDVVVSIEADLRVQHTFDSNYPVYSTVPPGAAASDEPQVSVMDENGEEGMEGAIAEYTFKRFGVPYTVTVECSEMAREQCKDTAQLAKDSALLKVVGGQAPQ
ncbi:MAG: hypothetical protein ABL894_00355 [Hyphomicrobium sp.]